MADRFCRFPLKRTDIPTYWFSVIFYLVLEVLDVPLGTSKAFRRKLVASVQFLRVTHQKDSKVRWHLSCHIVHFQAVVFRFKLVDGF